MQVSPFTYEPLLPDPISENGIIASLPEGAAVPHAESIASMAEPEPEAPPPPPSFSEEELEAAKKAAYDEGFGAGKNEGMREVDHEAQLLQQSIKTVLKQVNRQLPELQQQQAHYLNSKQSELGSLVLSCTGRIALHALRQNPISDIESMIRECMQTLMGKQELEVTVHPKLQAELTETFGRKLNIVTGDSLAPGDCKIRWDHGEASREIDRIWGEVEAVIERYFRMSDTQTDSNESNGMEEGTQSRGTREPLEAIAPVEETQTTETQPSPVVEKAVTDASQETAPHEPALAQPIENNAANTPDTPIDESHSENFIDYESLAPKGETS